MNPISKKVWRPAVALIVLAGSLLLVTRASAGGGPDLAGGSKGDGQIP
jgi:hypothetical protein